MLHQIVTVYSNLGVQLPEDGVKWRSSTWQRYETVFVYIRDAFVGARKEYFNQNTRNIYYIYVYI